MNIATDNLVLELAANHPLPIKKARGVRVHCVKGAVWMTVAGVPGDIILRTGQFFHIPCNGLALIEAIPEARIRFEAPVPQLRVWWCMIWNKKVDKAGSLMGIASQALTA